MKNSSLCLALSGSGQPDYDPVIIVFRGSTREHDYETVTFFFFLNKIKIKIERLICERRSEKQKRKD
jgi:hypothetical protein